jgi:hypothetical protein
MSQRLPDFSVYVVGPGNRGGMWTHITAGCWRATQRAGHWLEFVLSANANDDRHVEVLAMLAWFHGPADQRFDLGHTVPLGEPWTPGSACEKEMPRNPGDIEATDRNGAGAILGLRGLTFVGIELSLKEESPSDRRGSLHSLCRRLPNSVTALPCATSSPLIAHPRPPLQLAIVQREAATAYRSVSKTYG